MDWQSISREELQGLIDDALLRMDAQRRRLWQMIAIDPEKWSQQPYGDGGGGFWAVALFGKVIVWYNDIEEGFNASRYQTYGAIDEYWCNQDELEWVIGDVLAQLNGGPARAKLGPPQDLKS